MGFLVRWYAGRDSGHYGANAVMPAFGGLKTVHRTVLLKWFESAPEYTKKSYLLPEIAPLWYARRDSNPRPTDS